MDDLKPISHKKFSKFINRRRFKEGNNYALKNLKAMFSFKPLKANRKAFMCFLEDMDAIKFHSMRKATRDIDNMIRSGHRRLARSFNLCYRYIDDLIVFNNKKFLDYLKEIYPSQLTVEKANKSDHLADYLDLTFIIDSGSKLSTRLYDKRDDFDFHIVNFPFLSSNIPSGPSYGVYILQLIRYARCCSHYDDFRYRHKCLVDRLLSQGYKALRLEKSFKKFYGRYQDLIEKYRRSVNAMVSDSFPGQFLFNM